MQCHAGWIDPDSPEEAFTTSALYEEDTREYELVSHRLMRLARCYLSGVHTDADGHGVVPTDLSMLRRFHLMNITTRTHLFDPLYWQIFSDEFEQDGRSFDDGSDPRWTAIDKNDCESLRFPSLSSRCQTYLTLDLSLYYTDTNDALHFYRPENAITANGVLNIETTLKDNKYRAFNEKTKKYFSDAKHVQSAMLQGWNKFCFTGGIIEFNAKLPGNPKTGGLWPALWMLGNLVRGTYVGSSNWMWPYSYNECDEDNRKSQTISACSKVGHFGMEPGVGRGSAEIDILEAMMGSNEKLPNTNVTRPYFSSSLQIAPGVKGVRPLLMHKPKPVSLEVRYIILWHKDC